LTEGEREIKIVLMVEARKSAKSPLVIAVVGRSGSGKTVLISKLLAELSGRKHRVAAAKRCPHGFDLDVKGKDSWQFAAAGASGVVVTSPGRIGVVKEVEAVPVLADIAGDYFSGFDVVLGEGFGRESGIAKIVVLREGVEGYTPSPQDNILAWVSDVEKKTDEPVFRPDDISAIADFIEQLLARGG
jgi:molybdopterin-guanine dinucleotide biosynthesis protein MobB